MILRIEDTDAERSTESSVENIMAGLTWMGITWDEGPYFQSQRFPRYQEAIQQLLETGHAYRCVCTKERLEALRAQQTTQKEKPKYDGHCRDQHHSATSKMPFVVRFKTPLTGTVVLDDKVKGTITFQNTEMDDLVIARSDGSPTYQLGVVVDDWDMRITHVIRGDDHLTNTPRQIHILNALGAPLPVYAHIPMLLGQDGKRLSKRHGAVGVLHYRDAGYLPEAILNYLVRLGWSHGDQELFSRTDMIHHFDLEHIHTSPACFNVDKLNWLNQHYLKTLPTQTVVNYWQPFLTAFPPQEAVYLGKVADLLKERSHTLVEMTQSARYFLEEVPEGNIPASAVSILEALKHAFAVLEPWDETTLHHVLTKLVETLDLGFGKIAQPLRLALTGQAVSPPMAAVAALLGQARTLQRLERAIQQSRKKA
jgi:glutamyl-tRNA synthetase